MESKGITVINLFDKTTTALSSSFQNVMEIIPPLHETGYINFQRNEKKEKKIKRYSTLFTCGSNSFELRCKKSDKELITMQLCQIKIKKLPVYLG